MLPGQNADLFILIRRMARRQAAAASVTLRGSANAAGLRAGVWAAMTCAIAATASPQEPPAEPGPSASSAEAAEERFDVWEYRVLGAQILPAQSVERALYSYLGPGK